MKHWIISLLALLGLCPGCHSQQDRIPLLTPQAYEEAVANDENAVILDVRRPDEYAEGHLKNAILLNVLDEPAFKNGIRQLDPSKTYYIYCRSGRRSHHAATLMHETGFRVADMKGGISAWIEAGKEVVKDNE